MSGEEKIERRTYDRRKGDPALLCSDCALFVLVPLADTHSTCAHPDAKDVVTGDQNYADLEREFGKCGHNAKNWRHKQ